MKCRWKVERVQGRVFAWPPSVGAPPIVGVQASRDGVQTSGQGVTDLGQSALPESGGIAQKGWTTARSGGNETSMCVHTHIYVYTYTQHTYMSLCIYIIHTFYVCIEIHMCVHAKMCLTYASLNINNYIPIINI